MALMQNLFDHKIIMIVVSHADDELLGLGATMHKLISKHNVKTHVVILGEGVTARAESRDTAKWQKEMKTQRHNIKTAQQCIGYHSVAIYDFADNRFDSVPLLDIIKV